MGLVGNAQKSGLRELLLNARASCSPAAALASGWRPSPTSTAGAIRAGATSLSTDLPLISYQKKSEPRQDRGTQKRPRERLKSIPNDG